MNHASSINPPAQSSFLPSLSNPNPSSSSLLDAVVGSRSANYDRALPPLAEARGGDVSELERNLQKRKSLIPHLENELAELEAQIKAAEERLARAAQAPQAQPQSAQAQ